MPTQCFTGQNIKTLFRDLIPNLVEAKICDLDSKAGREECGVDEIRVLESLRHGASEFGPAGILARPSEVESGRGDEEEKSKRKATTKLRPLPCRQRKA